MFTVIQYRSETELRLPRSVDALCSLVLLLILFSFHSNAQVSPDAVQPQPLINPSLELSLSEGGWEKTGNTSLISTGTLSSPVPYDGSHALRLSGTGATLRQAIYTPLAGHRYRVTAWAYNHGTIGLNDLGADSVVETTSGHGASWKQISVECVATGSPLFLYASYGSGTDKAYLDLFNASDVSTSDDLNLPPPSKTIRYPSQVFNLSCWKITLPINDAEEIYTPTLYDYSIDPWFKIVHDRDGWAIQFRANHGGATTSGSKNPRSELREMIPDYHYQDSKSAASWSTSQGTHTMWIREKITHLTYVKPHTVAGQIHDASDDVTVFRVEGLNGGSDGNGGTVGVEDTLAKLWITDGNTTHGYLVDPAYKLGTVFEVKFIAHNGMIEYEYNGQRLPYKKIKNVSGCFFKIGNYTQSNADTAPNEVDTAYAETYVYDYSITHDYSTGVESQNTPAVATGFSLEQNYPNPFNPATTIRFTLPVPGQTSITIYDNTGKKISTLVDEMLQSGTYNVTWNAHSVSSGVYFFRLQSHAQSKIKAMLFLK